MKGEAVARVYPNEEQAIRNLQRYLRQLSSFDEDINPIAVNGLWNDETSQALTAFQQKNRLPATGTADEQTWNLLFSQYTASLEENSPPEPFPIFPRYPQNDFLSIGSRGFIVEIIQYMLYELSISYEGFDDVEINGEFDRQTEAAVKEFQRRNLLPANGKVDKKTWNRLVTEFEIVSNSQ